jgi:hypothetical protein
MTSALLSALLSESDLGPYYMVRSPEFPQVRGCALGGTRTPNLLIRSPGQSLQTIASGPLIAGQVAYGNGLQYMPRGPAAVTVAVTTGRAPR